MTIESGNFLPYESLRQPGGSDFDVFWQDVIDQTCAVHRLVPAMYRPIIPNLPSAPQGLLQPVIAGIWDDICQRPGPPPGPTPATALGCPIDYRIEARWRRPDQSIGTFSVTRTGVTAAYWAVPEPPPNTNGRGNLEVRFCGGSTVNLFVGDDGASIDERLEVTITPLGTETGDCCSDPPFVPPQNNALPPEFTINLPGGPVTIPIQWPGVTLDPEGNIISFEPRITTPLGEVSFEGGGLSFNPRIPIAPEINIPIGRPSNGGGGATSSEVSSIVNNSATQTVNQLTQVINEAVDLTPILDAIASLTFQIDLASTLELIQCYASGGGGEVTPEELTGNTEGGRFDLPEGTFAVLVEATQPVSAATRSQTGSGSANGVFYWGWHSINYVGGADGVRKELQFLTQSIPCEQGAVSVTVNPVFGNTCSVTAFASGPPCEEPEQFIVPVTQPA